MKTAIYPGSFDPVTLGHLDNRKLNPELDTVFLMTSAEYMYLSSSVVKDIAVHGGSVAGFVPDGIIQDIVRRTRKEG